MTILGKFYENDYTELVINEKNKNIIKEVMYLLDNFYFQSVKASIFKKKYLDDFQKFEITRGEILIKEGGFFQNIYLIKEGELEITINQTLLELNQLINILEQKLGLKTSDKPALKTGNSLI